MSETPPVDVTASHEATQPQIKIRRYTASEIDDATLQELDLYKLVREETNFEDEEKAKELTKGLFQNDDPPTRVSYIAEADGKAVGYMVLNKLEMNDSDTLGYAFASWLYTHNPEFANSIWDSPEVVAVVHGVTTSSEWRKKGIQKKLWEQMTQEVDPAIIVGESKNPAAVVSRARAAEPFGYRTYFGLTDVTPNADETVPTPSLIKNLVDTDVDLHTAGESPIQRINDGLIQAPNKYFGTETPDVKTFPPVIQRAFQPVLAAQLQAGEHVTVMQPLISIKNKILTRPV